MKPLLLCAVVLLATPAGGVGSGVANGTKPSGSNPAINATNASCFLNQFRR